MKILIVEDEKLLAGSVRTLLVHDGFDADCVYDGVTGVKYAVEGMYDLVILDVMLPGMNGYDVARQLRGRRSDVPVLMLTARSGLEDRVKGLDSGADYYLTKPFETKELLACVHALLRRKNRQTEELSFGRTVLDLSTGILSCGEKSIRLSEREFELMKLLLGSGERNISKETLLLKVWGYDSEATENNVEVYVGFLRKKLAGIHSDIRIEALRRLGYHLEAEKYA